jgi:LacI family transcriptional regulator
MHVTLKDVARHAGVSAKTVSRVVNNQGEISATTRTRVQNAIQELGYRPNILARSLVNRRSNMLAVVASGIEYFGPSRAILGIEQQADEFGYTVSLNLLPNAAEANTQAVLDELVARRVDGIVWAVPEIGENRQWITPHALKSLPPIVFLSMETRPELGIVAVDNRAGATLAVNHLIEQKYKRIGIITGPYDWWEARERLAGWREALNNARLEASSDLIVEGDWTAASGGRAMQKLLSQVPRPDALFASNDQMALGALGVLHRAGIDAPRAMAMVGFDNIPESEFFLPPLTTVFQNMIELGRAAVRELHTRIEAEHGDGDGNIQQMTRLMPTLIVRASSQRV